MDDEKVDSCVAYLGNTFSIDWKAITSRLKPGSHIVAVCPLLGHHRITTAIEDCGVEVRDCITVLGNPSYMISLGRMPLEGTVADNVLRYGVGAINVDRCRVKAQENDLYFNRSLFQGRYEKKGLTSYGGLANWKNGDNSMPNSEGRWPANVIIQDDEGIKAKFPFSKSCNSPSSAKPESKYRPGQGNYQPQGRIYPGDSGSASRFFYTVTEDNSLLKLMRYMCKLCTPPQGKALVVGLDSDAIIGLESLGFNVFQYSSNE